MELATTQSLAFEGICDQRGFARTLSAGQRSRLECYLGSEIPSHNYYYDPDGEDWACWYFLDIDPGFIVNLPKDIRASVLNSLQHRLWTMDFGIQDYRSWFRLEPNAVFGYLGLELALMRGDENLEELLKTSDAKRKGYATAQKFLTGDRAGAAQEFVKLISRRRAGHAAFSPLISLIAKLSLLSQGDYANALDEKLENLDFPAIDQLLEDLASFHHKKFPLLAQIRKSAIVQQPAPGLEALIVWLFRDALGISIEPPQEALKRFSEQGFTRLAEQLASQPAQPWIGQMVEIKPWEAWLKQLETNVEFSTPVKKTPKRSLPSSAHTAWNLGLASLEAYEQSGPERLSKLDTKTSDPVDFSGSRLGLQTTSRLKTAKFYRLSYLTAGVPPL